MTKDHLTPTEADLERYHRLQRRLECVQAELALERGKSPNLHQVWVRESFRLWKEGK